MNRNQNKSKPATPEQPTDEGLDETPCSLCLICGAPVWDYDPKYCCNGHDCGCMGQPTDPCVCSVKCSNALFDGIGRGYEERRINAGIEKYQANVKVRDRSGSGTPPQNQPS